jgi:hypothetical protein
MPNPLRIVLIASTALLVAAQNYKLFVENMGDRDTGGVSIYWLGNPKSDKISVNKDKKGALRPEKWLEMLNPGELTAHTGEINDRWVIRGMPSEDYGGFRAGIRIEPGIQRKGKPNYPYTLVFQALANEKGAGRLELGYPGPSNEEDKFEWIEQGGTIGHSTFPGRAFTLRDEREKEVIKILIFPVDDEEL